MTEQEFISVINHCRDTTTSCIGCVLEDYKGSCETIIMRELPKVLNNLKAENERLKTVEKEHQKLNGELREEIEKLIRCKDCSYYDITTFNVGYGWCKCLSKATWDDFYCGCAEKGE